ncbi:MAG: transporter related [Anaerocolumna sp.]|nr:transporter related [Anaerocolumna sp.]
MQDQNNNIIQIKNVKKIYRMGNEKIYAVDDVSFDIQKGEFCCLLGTSGSGKSTLLNLMAGIEKITGGQIIIKGKKIHKMNENSLARFRQRYLGFVFQSYNLMNSMTALENVEFPLVFKRVKTKKRRTMSREMLKQVGLGNRMNHRPKEMSGGQQQRVGIARAFVAKPEIVFADEPTGNLDTKTAMEVLHLIRTIAKENNQTIVMVTHDKRVAQFADKVINILDGKIQSVEIAQNTPVLTESGNVENVVAESEAIKSEDAMSEAAKSKTTKSITTEGELAQSKATESETIKSEATHNNNQKEVETDVLEPKLDVSADMVKTS